MANNDEILTAEAYSSEYQRILEVLKEAVKGDSAEKWKSECKRVKKEFVSSSTAQANMALPSFVDKSS